jgi:hypothetical protein
LKLVEFRNPQSEIRNFLSKRRYRFVDRAENLDFSDEAGHFEQVFYEVIGGGEFKVAVFDAELVPYVNDDGETHAAEVAYPAHVEDDFYLSGMDQIVEAAPEYGYILLHDIPFEGNDHRRLFFINFNFHKFTVSLK